MVSVQKIAEGLQILIKYACEDCEFYYADHKEFAVGVRENAKVSKDDRERLDELGFWEGDDGCWHIFQ
jgi:hypothetical protein